MKLQSWRLAFNGAEQVSPETIRRFSERFQTAGFRPEAMQPVYGLAESSVGLAFPDIKRPPLIVAETRESDSQLLQKLEKQIINHANDLIGMPPDDVHLVAPHTVLKTSSGKIRRSACKELYEQNRLLQTKRGLWVHLGRLFLTSILPAAKRAGQRLMTQLYAAYAWSLFGLLGFIGFITVMLLPVMHSRWAVLRGLLRFLAFATRTRITVTGLDNLPDKQACVYVANHASYIDALVMIAVLPRHVGFVGKIELSRQHLLRLFLKRMEVEFVERFEQDQAMIDA